MSSHSTVEELAGDVAKWLTSIGVRFAITLGKARMDVLEIVGRELMQGIA